MIQIQGIITHHLNTNSNHSPSHCCLQELHQISFVALYGKSRIIQKIWHFIFTTNDKYVVS
jgi:hypothetical protein